MLKGQEYHPWSEEAVARLKELRAEGVNHAEIGRQLGRTRKAVAEKLIRLASGQVAVPPPRPWTAQEIEQLKYLRDTERRSWGEISRIMGRPSGTVSSKHHYLGNSFKLGRAESNANFIVPEEVKADWHRRQMLSHRTITAALCGDPLPGQSALERRA